jgi:cell division protein FtsW (lipid II flippase)
VTARNRELFGLVVAGLIAGTALAAITVARDSELSPTAFTYAAAFLGVYLVAHVVVRTTAPHADGALLPIAAVLTAFGLVMNYRLDPAGGRQALWVLIGVGVLCGTLILLRHDYRALESYRYLFGVAAVVLLLLPSFPGIGLRQNEARLWVDLGVIQFQPGELAKICLVVFLAGYLREKREVLGQGRIKDFGPLLAIWGAAMLVIVQTNDLGSALLNFGIFLAMLYVATGKAVFVGAGLALFLGGAALLYTAIDRVSQRVTIWLTPWTDEPVYCSQTGEQLLRQDCDSYQLVRSLYSIGNGGYGGTGLGDGVFTTPDGTELIPHLRTDFIYSAIAQEVGLIGAAALLLVFMLFVVRGMRIALHAQDGFSKLLAAGLTFGFALQVFVIVGGVLRVVPLTGITLPYVSYGGTSIVANFVLLALLLLVSNRANALSRSDLGQNDVGAT